MADRCVRVALPTLPALERYAESLRAVWGRATLSNNGPCVLELERRYAAYAGGGGRVLAAANGELALTLIVAALRLPPGSHAVLPSLGHPATANAIEWNGLRPRFVDVDPDDWCLHAEQLEGALEGVSLILATHLFGAPCDVHGLERAAAATGVALVYDAAHAVATWVDARHVSDFGHASALSLDATKLAPAGEGGLAVLRDEALAERFDVLRVSGVRDGVSAMRGLNAKLSELHAALAVLSVDGLERELEHRHALLAIYRRRLGRAGGVRLQRTPPQCTPSPSFMVADFGAARDHVRDALARRGIDTRRYFPAMHLMPRFADDSWPLPVSERLDRSLLALPLHSALSEEQVEEICALALDALAQRKLEG